MHPGRFCNGRNDPVQRQTVLEMGKMTVAMSNQFWKWLKRVSQAPIDFENSQNESRKSVSKTKQGFAGCEKRVSK